MQLPHALIAISFALLAACLPRPAAKAFPCKDLVDQTTKPGFDWKSSTALDMARCLQSQRLPTPPFSTCIFYTASCKAQAVAYANATNRTTIYDVYEPEIFNRSIWPAKEWDALGHIRDLFRVTSKAYAMSCSGEAHLVLPDGVKDEEVCRESIWVTDEYEAIRAGDSGITLPIWRVTWREVEKGIWGWTREQLRAAGVRLDLVRRWFGNPGEQEVLEPGDDVMARVSQKVSDMKKQWSWDGLEDGTMEDLWALKSGMCGR